MNRADRTKPKRKRERKYDELRANTKTAVNVSFGFTVSNVVCRRRRRRHRRCRRRLSAIKCVVMWNPLQCQCVWRPCASVCLCVCVCVYMCFRFIGRTPFALIQTNQRSTEIYWHTHTHRHTRAHWAHATIRKTEEPTHDVWTRKKGIRHTINYTWKRRYCSSGT